MLRFPFKRHIVVLVACILLIGVFVPIASFAKGTPPGEQKRTNVHLANATAGQPTPITTDCSSPQLLVKLNKGDVFNASATLTSSDSNEQSEGEFLQILDGSVTPPAVLLTVDYNTGKGSVTFTAKVNNDPIQACIINFDSDETGTVTFTVTPPKLIHIHVETILENATSVAFDVILTPVGNNMAKVNSIKFTATIPGLRCAGFAVPGVKITSQGHVVLDLPRSKTPILLFRPGITAAEKSVIIYNGTPPVSVALGHATIHFEAITDYASVIEKCNSDSASTTLSHKIP